MRHLWANKRNKQKGRRAIALRPPGENGCLMKFRLPRSLDKPRQGGRYCSQICNLVCRRVWSEHDLSCGCNIDCRAPEHYHAGSKALRRRLERDLIRRAIGS
jgi:hypothetical protein